VSFVHDDPEFPRLLGLVSEDAGIAPALVEKDYWVTHCMWALHETGLEIWFKGGTSLSKGFGLIQRFSEDLDLMVQHGSVTSLPAVSSWTSMNKGPVASRRLFFDALPGAFVIPSVTVELDLLHRDKHARGANVIGRYPGVLLEQLAPTMTDHVCFEIGRARVVPFVVMPLTSFVHDFLERSGQLASYSDNRPRAVRCVHPLVTLLEKLDALSRRYGREPSEPDGFVRHYEDAANIIRLMDRVPPAVQSARDLATDMLHDRDIAALPSPDEPALLLKDADRRRAVDGALGRIMPMYWGKRIPIEEACGVIRDWVRCSFR